MTETLEQTPLEVLREELARRVGERMAAEKHPAGLLDHVQCIDAEDGRALPVPRSTTPKPAGTGSARCSTSWIGEPAQPRPEGQADRDHLARPPATRSGSS